MSKAARLQGTVAAAITAAAFALAGLTGAVPSLAASAPPAAKPAVGSGLQVQMTSITPSTLRPGNPVEITGTVTNVGDATWRSAQVFVVMSASPITTRDGLAIALRSDPTAPIGDRIVEPGLFAEIGDLRGGDERPFTLRVPYGMLPVTDTPGVYWLGVQVLATPPSGIRDDLADARARTFITLLPDQAAAPVNLALMWPFTHAVPELRTGVFTNDDLGRAFAPGGRLSQLLAMAQTAPPGRLNWLVDPAVISAAERMSDGYVVQGPRRRHIGESAVAARDWLDLLRAQLGGDGSGRTGTTLALPYGDPDVTSLVHGRLRGVLRPAMAAGERVMADEPVGAISTLWPVDGRSDRRTLSAGLRAGASLALLSDHSLPEAERDASVLLVPTAAGNSQTLVADNALFDGGPRPGPPGGALQVRQRLLAETALLSLSKSPGKPASVVAAAPRGWHPGELWAEADFFAGLDVPWLRLSPLSDLLLRTSQSYAGRFTYPGTARRAELTDDLLTGTRSLRRVSTTLSSLLTAPATEIRRYERAIGTSASVHWRQAPKVGRAISTAQANAVRTSLDSVDVQTSSFVTLSSSSGRFPVTITNGLREQISVGLKVSPDDPALGIAAVRPVLVQSQQRSTITITARAERIGLTSVTVRPVTADGRPFGQAEVISVRATQYGLVGWLIVGVGLTVLFATSALRIARRLRGRRATVASPP